MTTDDRGLMGRPHARGRRSLRPHLETMKARDDNALRDLCRRANPTKAAGIEVFAPYSVPVSLRLKSALDRDRYGPVKHDPLFEG